MRKLPRRLGSCVKHKVKSTHPSNISGGLQLLGQVETRYKKMLRKDYSNFKTDEGQKTKTSSYTQKFRKKYGPEVRSLPEIAKATGFL
jgi:hypothetical protein